jgi:hypothetical protein
MTEQARRPEVISVNSAGDPIWKGEITDYQVDMVLGGLLIPNQSFSKAMALEIKTLREQKELR